MELMKYIDKEPLFFDINEKVDIETSADELPDIY
jgi:hypothetical protein